MGLGFVLIAWTFIFGLLGTPIAGGLGYWSWRNGIIAGSPSKRRAILAGLLPFVLIGVWLGWFVTYAFYCYAVLKVDPGLGDGWQVPLRNNYFLCMIDVTDFADILKDDCTGIPTVPRIWEMAEVGDKLIGRSDSKGNFIFDTASGELRQYPDRATALTQFSPQPQLLKTIDFYRSKRPAGPDRAWILALLFAAGSISWAWYKRFIKAGKPTGALPAT